MLVDEFLPVFEVSDSLATVVHADLGATWGALTEVDLLEVGRQRPLVGALGALRMLPEVVSHLLHGEGTPAAPARTAPAREAAAQHAPDAGGPTAHLEGADLRERAKRLGAIWRPAQKLWELTWLNAKRLGISDRVADR